MIGVGRRGCTASLWCSWAFGDDVAAGRLHLLIQLDLPEEAGEHAPGEELADVWLDRLPGRHPHDQLRVGTAREGGVHRTGEGATEARVDVGDAQPEFLVPEHLDRRRASERERLG